MIQNLYINLYSYQDSKSDRIPTNTSMIEVYDQNFNTIFSHLSKPIDSGIFGFRLELTYLLDAIVEFLPDITTNNSIVVSTSEKNLTLFIQNLNRLCSYCHSRNGTQEYKLNKLHDFIYDVILDEQCIFNTRNKSWEVVEPYLEKLIPILVNSKQSYTFSVQKYKPSKLHKKSTNILEQRQYQVATTVRRISFSRAQKGLSKEQIVNEIIQNKYI